MMVALAQMTTRGVQQRRNLGSLGQELPAQPTLARAEVPPRPRLLRDNAQDAAKEVARPVLLLARHPLGQQWTQG